MLFSSRVASSNNEAVLPPARLTFWVRITHARKISWISAYGQKVQADGQQARTPSRAPPVLSALRVQMVEFKNLARLHVDQMFVMFSASS